METRDLQTFLAVAASGSITKASVMLGRSQPSVTRIIQDLEAELGFALLHRVGRRIQLSEEGAAFEEEARRLLMSFDELAARAKAIAVGKGQILKVATTAAIGTGLLPAAIAQLVDPELPYETHIGQFLPSIVAQELRSGRSEIGFSSMPLDTPGLDVLRLYSAPDVVIALREDDPLTELDVVPLSALSGRRLVTMLNPLRFQLHVAKALAARNIEIGAVIRTNISYGALQIVRQTGVAAVIDPVTAFGVQLPGVIIRPIDVTVPYYWGVLAGENRPLRPVALALVEAAEAVAERCITGFKKLDPAMAGQLVVEPETDINNGI